MSVTVYGKKRCHACSATVTKLDEKGIAHTYVDASLDAEAYEYITSLGYLQVPVVVAGDDHWSGYNPDKIEGLAEVKKAA